MADVNEAVVDEAVHEGSSMTSLDLFSLFERRHGGDRPGIDRETLTAYAEALAARRDYSFDAEGFLAEMDDRIAESDDWEGADRIYRLGKDRLSQFPATWHDELGGSTDVTDYLAFLERLDDVSVPGDDQSAGGRGIPEDTLLELVMALGRTDRKTAHADLERAREEGTVVEDADQHPQAGVFLADSGEDDLRDQSLDG